MERKVLTRWTIGTRRRAAAVPLTTKSPTAVDHVRLQRDETPRTQTGHGLVMTAPLPAKSDALAKRRNTTAAAVTGEMTGVGLQYTVVVLSEGVEVESGVVTIGGTLHHGPGL